MNISTKLKILIGAISLVGGLVLSVLTWGNDVFGKVGEIGQSLGWVDSDEAVQTQAAAHKLGQTTAMISHILKAYDDMPNGPIPLAELPQNLQDNTTFVEQYTYILDLFTQNKATMASIRRELQLATQVEPSTFRTDQFAMSNVSPGSRLLQEEIRRRYGERAEEAFQLGLEIKGAIFQAQDNFFTYGAFSIEGVSGTTTYKILADRALKFGVESKTSKDIQVYIDDLLKRLDAISPGERSAEQIKNEAKEKTNRTLVLELGTLDYELSNAISRQRADHFKRQLFYWAIAATLAASLVVFVFRFLSAKETSN